MEYSHDFERKALDTEFGKIHYFVHKGSGDACLLLLHGLASSSKTWERLLLHLPESLDICMLDLLGHGASDAPELEYNIGIQVKILSDFIARERINCYLFGHSYGGWIAASYAAKGCQAKGLILEDSSGLKAFYEEVRGTKEREEYKSTVIERARSAGSEGHVVSSVLNDFQEGQLEDAELSAIKIPTLIIWGEDDNVIDRKFAKVFESGIGGSVLHIIKGARHTPHYAHPKTVAKILLDFMASHK